MLLRILFAGIAFFFAYRFVRRLLPATQREGFFSGRKKRVVDKGQLVKDPVCGTFVSLVDASKLRAGGETFYFCSRECKEKFQENSRASAN